MELFNFSLYALLLIYLWKKKKSWVCIVIVGMWAFSAFCGIFYTSSTVYRNGRYETSIGPFIYLFCALCVSLMPFMHQTVEIQRIQYNNRRWLNLFCIGIGILAIEPFVETLYYLIDFIITGRFLMLGAYYDDVATGQMDALIQRSSIGAKLATAMLMLKTVTPLLFFYYLQYKNRNRYILIGLFIAAIVPALANASAGSKTEIIFFLTYMIGLYLMLGKTLEVSARKLIKKLIISAGCIVIAMVIGLSIGRYIIGGHGDEENSAGAYLFQYTAESMYNFNENAYHEIRPLHGSMTCLPPMKVLGLTHIEISDRRDYNSMHMMGPAHLFYSYFGDFYLDFGAIGAFIIFIITSFLFCRIRIKQNMPLTSLSLLSLYLYAMMNSLFYFCFKANWMSIYGSLLFFVIAKIAEYLHNKPSKVIIK